MNETSATASAKGVPSDPLLVGLKKRRLVRFDISTQEKDTQVMAWVGPDKDLRVGLLIFGNDGEYEGQFLHSLAIVNRSKKLGTPGAVTPLNIMPATFRVFQTFERLTNANPQTVDTAMGVVSDVNLVKDDAQWAELAAIVKDFVEPDELREILLGRLPPSFADLCVKAVAQGCVLELDALSDEIAAGRLDYDDRLKGLGVEHPDDFQDRIEGREGYLRGFQAAMAALRASEWGVLGVLPNEWIESMLLQVRARGLAERPEIAFGLAIIAIGKMIARRTDTIGEDPFGRDSLIDSVKGSEILNIFSQMAASFVSSHYKVGTPQSVAQELAEKVAMWKMIPVDKSLL